MRRHLPDWVPVPSAEDAAVSGVVAGPVPEAPPARGPGAPGRARAPPSRRLALSSAPHLRGAQVVLYNTGPGPRRPTDPRDGLCIWANSPACSRLGALAHAPCGHLPGHSSHAKLCGIAPTQGSLSSAPSHEGHPCLVSPNCTPDAEGDAGPRPSGSEGGVPFAKLDTRTSFLGCRHPLGSPSGILPELQNGSCRGLFSSLYVLRPPDPVRSWPPLTQSGVPCPPPDPVSGRGTRPTAPPASGHHCRPALVSCAATLPLAPRMAPVGHWVECTPQAKLQFPRSPLPGFSCTRASCSLLGPLVSALTLVTTPLQHTLRCSVQPPHLHRPR